MSALRRDVLAALKDAGLTRKQYVEHWGGPSDKPHGGEWHGGSCGCSDDRCSGYHHDEDEECQCFPVCLEMVLDARRNGGAS